MKLSVHKWGALLVVFLLGVGLARHATSSSSRAGQGVTAALVSAPLPPAPASESAAAPALAPGRTTTHRIAAETLVGLPFAPSIEEAPLAALMMDRPPETPDADDSTENAEIGTPARPSQTGPRALASDRLETEPVLAETEQAVPNAPEDPAPITEGEARTAVLNMLGGEAAYFAAESDMAQAYAAAKKALRQQGIQLSTVKALAIIDFTLPSFDRRMAIYNPRTGEESRHLVAHGHHSGELYLKSYSNVPRSLQSSPGLYRIGRHYNGEHGRSVRMHGLQKNVNDLAYKRSIVLHSAWYVSYSTILENQLELGVPRIGRSHGCPAVSQDDLPEVLQKLQPGSYLFIHPVPTYVPSPQLVTPTTGGTFR